MSAAWIIPFIVIGGTIQTCGAAMNGKFVASGPWKLALETCIELCRKLTFGLKRRTSRSLNHGPRTRRVTQF
jgi:hypothetical protein